MYLLSLLLPGRGKMAGESDRLFSFTYIKYLWEKRESSKGRVHKTETRQLHQQVFFSLTCVIVCWVFRCKSCIIFLFFLLLVVWKLLLLLIDGRPCEPCWCLPDGCIVRRSFSQAATLMPLFIPPHVIIIILKSRCNLLCSVCVQKMYLHIYPE